MVVIDLTASPATVVGRVTGSAAENHLGCLEWWDPTGLVSRGVRSTFVWVGPSGPGTLASAGARHGERLRDPARPIAPGEEPKVARE